MDRTTSTQSADVLNIIAKSFSSWVTHRKPELLSYYVCKHTTHSDLVEADKRSPPSFVNFQKVQGEPA